MQTFLKRTLSAALVFLAPASVFASTLVWHPQQGWWWEGDVPAGSSDSAATEQALDLMNRAKAEEEAGRDSAARSLYQTVTKEFPETLYAAESWFQIGLLEEKGKNWERSFKAFQKVIDEYPGYGNFNRVVVAQYQVAEGLMQGNRVRFLGTIPIFRSPDTAISQFNKIIENAPFSEFAPLALFNIALLNRSRENPVGTIDALDRFINAYPRHFLLPDAYLLMAQTHASMVSGPEYDQGSTRDAISFYEDFLIQFPRNPRVAEAEEGLESMQEVLGRSKLLMGDWYYNYRANGKAATVLYNEVLSSAPGTFAAAVAQAQLNRIEAGETPPGVFSRLWGSFGSRDIEDDSAVYLQDSRPVTPEDAEARPPASLIAE